MKYKVVFAKFLMDTPDIEEEVFDGMATIETYDCQNEEDVKKVVADADAVIMGPIIVREKAIAAMTKCKIIQVFGVGFDRIDLKAASEKGIYVCNVPDYCVHEVADHTIGLLLMLNRKMNNLANVTKKGVWFSLPADISTPVMRLEGKTLGIVGFGRIGSAVANRAKAFGLRVVFYDPYVRLGIERSFMVERADDLNTLLEKSDIISIHTPLTDETHHLIKEEQLRMMKKTSLLINTARGPIIDSNALLKALKEGWISGAALDVVEEEPLNPKNPLLLLDNVLITPHRAFFSEEAELESRRKSSMNVLRVLQGKEPFNIVNEALLQRGIRSD
jgi:D-3-phosphoglycerate dehydrogenase